MARGRVYKRGSTWTWRVDSSSEQSTGGRRQPSKGGYRTKREAEDGLAEALSAIRRGEHVEPSTVTVKAYLEDWLDRTRADLRPSTTQSYKVAVARMAPYIGSVKLQALKPIQIERMWGKMRDADLAPKTIRNTHVVLRRALGDAERLGMIPSNPATKVRAPRVEQREHSVWTPAQVAKFIEHLEGTRLHMPVMLAATTGMRRAEVLGVRWRDVDLDAGTLTVAQTLTAVRGEPIITPPKTDGSRRTIPLPKRTIAALRSHRAAQAAERLAAGEVWDTSHDDLVFRTELGELVHPDLFSRAFSRAVAASGLPVIRLHDLRHSWATNAFAAGLAAKTVSQQLGHSGIAITLDTYTSVPEQTARDAVDTVARAMFGD